MQNSFRYLTIKDVVDFEGKRPDCVLVRRDQSPSTLTVIVLKFGNRTYFCEQLNKKVPLFDSHFSGTLRGSAI